MGEEENKTSSEKQTLGISSFKITFGDLSNLDALIEDCERKMSEKGLNVEHFVEMKKITRRVKNAKN